MKNKFIITFIINLIITLSEIVGGLLSFSLSLISDSIHNLTDALSALVGYIAVKLSEKENSIKYTFGLKRAEIIASFVNSLFLIIVSLFMIGEAIKRLIHPEPLFTNIMLISASIAFLGNTISVFLLKKPSKESLNAKSVYLHMFADSLASLSLVVAAILIKYTGLLIVDPILTILISLYISHEALEVLKSSTNILLEGSPEEIDAFEIKKALERLPEIKNIHHLHVWSLKDGVYLAEMHAEVDDYKISQTKKIKEAMLKVLEKFGIKHLTVQFEVDFCENKELIVSGKNQ